jgi:hypothetical protein
MTTDSAAIRAGYRGKNAALASFLKYPCVAIRRNHRASNRSHAVKRLCHPGVTGWASHPGTLTGLGTSGIWLRTPSLTRAKSGSRATPSTAMTARARRTPMKTFTQ